MRKILKILASAGVALGWCFMILHFTMPGGLPALQDSVGRLSRDYSIPFDGADSLTTILDDSVPLAGPDAVGMARQNGWLRAQAGQLVNETGEPIRLRGMSGDTQYAAVSSIRATRDYGANLYRAAPHIDRGTTGKDALYAAIDNALSLDMYVIAGWHMQDGETLSDRADDAIAFFDELSAQYADQPGVLYEISGDPGDGVSWEDLYAYADRVIPAIRRNAPGALVITGTPEHSVGLAIAARQPLPYDNVVYAYRYDSGAEQAAFRTALDAAGKAQLTVIATWSLGDGEAAERHAIDFLAYAEESSLSWANWSLSNEDAAHAALLPTVESLGNWTPEDLTVSGKLAFSGFSK